MKLPRLLVIVLACAGLLSSAACTPPPDTAAAPAAPAATTAAADSQAPPSAAPVPEEKRPAPVLPGLVAWWTRPELISQLQLPKAQSDLLIEHLRNLELSYQLAQSDLRQIRVEQLRMLEDPSVAAADIERFHRERLRTASVAMLDLNIAARLWVREHVTPEQLAGILRTSPGFFRVRWFRSARVPTVQGTVREDAS